MTGIVAFHIVILLLALVILGRIVPLNTIGAMLGYLHGTVGITAPPLEQARKFAIVWLAAITAIVDGCLALLVFLTSRLQ